MVAGCVLFFTDGHGDRYILCQMWNCQAWESTTSIYTVENTLVKLTCRSSLYQSCMQASKFLWDATDFENLYSLALFTRAGFVCLLCFLKPCFLVEGLKLPYMELPFLTALKADVLLMDWVSLDMVLDFLFLNLSDCQKKILCSSFFNGSNWLRFNVFSYWWFWCYTM